MLLVSIVLFVWNNTDISIEKWKWLGKSRQALPLQYNAEPFSLCCSSCPLSGKYKRWDATPPHLEMALCSFHPRLSLLFTIKQEHVWGAGQTLRKSSLDTCQDCWCENVIWFILHRLHLLRGKSLALMDWGGGWKLNDISCASLSKTLTIVIFTTMIAESRPRERTDQRRGFV